MYRIASGLYIANLQEIRYLGSWPNVGFLSCFMWGCKILVVTFTIFHRFSVLPNVYFTIHTLQLHDGISRCVLLRFMDFPILRFLFTQLCTPAFLLFYCFLGVSEVKLLYQMRVVTVIEFCMIRIHFWVQKHHVVVECERSAAFRTRFRNSTIGFCLCDSTVIPQVA